MVKICPTCKKSVPLSAKACPMCGGENLVTAPAPDTVVTAVANDRFSNPKIKKARTPIIFFAIIMVFITIFAVIKSYPLMFSQPKSEAAIHVDRMIDAIGEVTIESEREIIDAEEAVSGLSDREYGQLENLQKLKEARAKYDELKELVLDGYDKTVYDLILLYLDKFKNPSSVQLVSGTMVGNGQSAFLCISATNGFGGTTKGYYCLNPVFIHEVDDNDSYQIELCKGRDDLDVKKINRALEEKINELY